MAEDRDFQSAHEMGKIYQSITDSKILSGFFLESVSKFISASEGFLFLVGVNDQFWLESATVLESPVAKSAEVEARIALRNGKPLLKQDMLALPLVVRNHPIGVACFMRNGRAFSQRDLLLGQDMAAQMAAALKNIFLYEENLKMERLAAIGQTVSMVIHEIKNIMQIAQLSNEFIARGVEEKNETYLLRGINKMGKTLKEMNGFVVDMLSLTKNYQFEHEKVNLGQILKELEDDLKEKAQAQNVRLDFKIEEKFPPVDADGRGIFRALLNLLKNAMEACDKPQSYVKIDIRSLDDTRYEIRIEDNGIGMHPETRAKIFQPFFSTKGTQGTGLGLMIIEKTIKMHHGSIVVEGEHGKGSTFRLVLPKHIKGA